MAKYRPAELKKTKPIFFPVECSVNFAIAETMQIQASQKGDFRMENPADLISGTSISLCYCY
jgi:hypothetical protein